MRAAGSAVGSSAGVAGFRGVVSGVLRGLAVGRRGGGSSPSAGRLAVVAVVVLGVLAFPSVGWATKYFDSTIGVSGSTAGLTFGDSPADVAVNESSVADGNPAANGDLYIVDSANHRIQRINADGSFDLMWGGDVAAPAGGSDLEVCSVAGDCQTGVASAGNGTQAGNGTLNNPQGVAVDQETGNVYVSDRDNRRVSVYTADGGFIRSFGQDVVDTGPGNAPLVPVNEQQTIQLFAAFDFGCFCPIPITGGTFTLTFGADTTAGIAYNASATDVRQALEGLPSIAPGDVTVTGGPGPDNAWNVEFAGAYAGTDVAQMTASGAELVPPGSFGPPFASTSTTVEGGLAPDYEVCTATAGDVCKTGIGSDNPSDTSPGRNPGQYAAGTTSGGYSIDVSKPDGNPASGKVYLANTDSRRVEVYDLDGSAPTNFAGSGVQTGFAVGEPRKVAVDGDEIVYASIVPGNSGNIVRYDADAGAFMDPLNVRTLVASFTNQPGDVVSSTSKQGLEVDRVSGNLLVAHGDSAVATGLVEIATPGATPSIADVHATVVPGTNNWTPAGVGINPDTGKIYVPASTPLPSLQGRTVVFDDDGVAPIEIVPLPATDVGATSANLAATINPAPGGPTGHLTSYRFEMSKTGLDGSWTEVASDALVPPDGDSDADTPVQTHVTDLEPNTFYRFRVVATRANNTGAVVSGEGFFLTDPAPPSLSGLRVNQVRDTSADLRGRVNPNNQATSYRFRYEVIGSGGEQQTPVRSAGSGGEPVPVGEQIDGLQPDTTYQYTLEAINQTGTTTTSTGTFATLVGVEPDAACPNAEFRTGSSAGLPDCRAYEMVSPVDKNGGDIATAEERAGYGSHLASGYHQASISGEKITYSSASAFAGAVGGHWSNQYLSARGADGWSTDPISSRRGRTVLEPACNQCADWYWAMWSFFQGFTPDLSSAWVRDDNVNTLSSDALEGYVNLYRRDNIGTYEPLTNQDPLGPNNLPSLSGTEQSLNGGLRFVGASDDLSHQVFVANAALTPDANQSPISPQFLGPLSQVYDLVDGELHLVSVLPDGTATTTASFAGTASDEALSRTQFQMLKNAVSDDGSRIFWTATPSTDVQGGPGVLYVRENPDQEQSAIAGGECTESAKACTIYIAGSGGDPAVFWAASADGSKVLYSTGNHPNWALHVYDVDTESSVQIAGQSLGVAATSDDLSHIYLVSRDDLADGAVAGENNLYAYRDGSYAFAGTVTEDDVKTAGQNAGGSNVFGGSITGVASSGRPSPVMNQTRATPDGHHFAFMSNSRELSESVAGYDNRDVVTGDPTFEVYRYDADAGELSCVSCKPSGERPRGVLLRGVHSPIDLELTNHPHSRAAASIPTWEHDNHASRLLSDDGGRLFFHSDDALLPADTNGVQDVYQWQALGSGGCDASDVNYSGQNDGCLSLISTGKDGAKSVFVDADPTGDDVFISTDESLDPGDPGLRDIYVAKVGGGFAPPAAPPDQCGVSDGGCQGTGAGGVAAGETTSSGSGGGNAASGVRQTLIVSGPSRRARVRAARTGVLWVRVRASEGGMVSVAANGKLGNRRQTVARKAVRVREAVAVTVKLRLNPAARRALGNGKALRLSVRVRLAGARTRTLTVTLKRGPRS